MKIAAKLVFLLSCCIFPMNANAQSSIPEGVALILPVPENYLKSEFSLRYCLYIQQSGTDKERSFYGFRTFEPGYFHTGITLVGEMLPDLQGLKLIHLTLSAGENFINDKGNMILFTATHEYPPPLIFQHFLIGLDAKGKIHYLSGHIFLDPLNDWLIDPSDWMAIAKTRLYYLQPDEITQLKASEGHVRFETKSNVLKRRVVIDFQDADRFCIHPKGAPSEPIAVVGDWTRE
ncbi:MAG TPA: hypothetical protein VHS96_14885 [Bacteroidia bacterium]|nr:hypothetical protein [Bacteroidia bacterium]